jgi:hypothetical protein
MQRKAIVFGAALLVLAGLATSAISADGPQFAADGALLFPADYRSWSYVTSGVNMSYAEGAPASAVTFDNIFVNPAALERFRATGAWPNGTVLLLERRASGTGATINKRGSFQGAFAGLEAHVKDSTRFKGGWAFFNFSGEAPAREIPHTAACYSCHEEHGAVDTTFVQFYPTLLPIAQQKKTLSAQ